MILDYNFFEADKIQEPQKGKILISEPFLSDNYFKRSVVLLCEHNDDGSIGFVLNKPVDMSIYELIEDFPESDVQLSVGGPVSTNTLHYIHTLGDIIPKSIHIFDNLYWGGDYEAVLQLIRSDSIHAPQIRFFLGYSGWSPNQLQKEIDANAWLVASIKAGEIMRPNNAQFWENILRRMGKKYEMWSNFPENPELN